MKYRILYKLNNRPPFYVGFLEVVDENGKIVEKITIANANDFSYYEQVLSNKYRPPIRGAT